MFSSLRWGTATACMSTKKPPPALTYSELGGGTSEVGFDYRIVAKRAGYEDHTYGSCAHEQSMGLGSSHENLQKIHFCGCWQGS